MLYVRVWVYVCVCGCVCVWMYVRVWVYVWMCVGSLALMLFRVLTQNLRLMLCWPPAVLFFLLLFSALPRWLCLPIRLWRHACCLPGTQRRRQMYRAALVRVHLCVGVCLLTRPLTLCGQG